MKTKIVTEYNNSTIDIAIDTVKKNKQALVFVNSKRSAEKTAEDISKKLKTGSPELEALSDSILKVLPRQTVQCERLAKCIKRGIAFHHAGLRSEQKDIIENAFREGKVKIIACTPTLAAGVDLPAFRAILQSLRRYTGFGLKWIPVLEYLQMSGRAGRPGYDSYGEAIAIAETDAARDEIESKYIFGEPECIYSKLAVEPVLRTYLLSLIASGYVKTKKQIMDFFSKTFWAFQYSDMERLQGIIEKMLQILQDYEFIQSSSDGFTSASDLEDTDYSASEIGKRVAQLYLDPLTADHIIKCLKRSNERQVVEFSFMQMVAYTLEMRPLLKVKTAEYDDVQEKLTLYNSNVLMMEPSVYETEYDEFMASVKTALFLTDWVDENDEEFLLEKYGIRPGEVRVKIENADWLLFASTELAKLLNYKKAITELVKLRFRLKYGVREELLALLKLKNVGRVRARKLFNNRIRDIGDIKNCDVNTLAQLIGKSVAIDVKKQVGIDVSKIMIKENKRKGQISLKDF